MGTKQRGDVIARYRTGEIPPLGSVAAEGGKPGGLLVILDTFHGHRQPERMREADKRRDDRLIGRADGIRWGRDDRQVRRGHLVRLARKAVRARRAHGAAPAARGDLPDERRWQA